MKLHQKWFLSISLLMQDGVFGPGSYALSPLAPSVSQEANTTFPLTYRARAAEGGEQACSPDELQQRLQAITCNDFLRNNLPALVPCSDRNLGQLEHCPAVSCSDIVAQSQVVRPFVYYWIRSSNGTAMLDVA